MTGWLDRLTFYALLALGLVLAMTPLALWLATTEAATDVVRAVAALAAVGVGICLLASYRNAVLKPGGETRRPEHMDLLSDEFLAEAVRLEPMTHHNRLPGDPVYQRKADRLKRLLGRRPK
ncbi:MAG: hypothetical protein QF578_00535 [Alphaproteobacteria bacterium]|nr:hypothetical protein [Alphaproteobacteria bacterium]MDP6563290.1 hypothetical protein [Alphaproteobacteria bacterium]MDP6812438.1 hypothetical protein [Alphaproteobacteria bacterium]